MKLPKKLSPGWIAKRYPLSGELGEQVVREHRLLAAYFPILIPAKARRLLLEDVYYGNLALAANPGAFTRQQIKQYVRKHNIVSYTAKNEAYAASLPAYVARIAELPPFDKRTTAAVARLFDSAGLYVDATISRFGAQYKVSQTTLRALFFDNKELVRDRVLYELAYVLAKAPLSTSLNSVLDVGPSLPRSRMISYADFLSLPYGISGLYRVAIQRLLSHLIVRLPQPLYNRAIARLIEHEKTLSESSGRWAAPHVRNVLFGALRVQYRGVTLPNSVAYTIADSYPDIALTLYKRYALKHTPKLYDRIRRTVVSNVVTSF